MLQEDALPNISNGERAHIAKRVQCELRLERLSVIGAWFIAIITVFFIILLVNIPELKGFNPNNNEQILSSVTNELFEEHSYELYEFRQAQAEANTVAEKYDRKTILESAFFIGVIGIVTIISFITIMKVNASEKSPSVFTALISLSPVIAFFSFFIFVGVVDPVLKVNKFNNVSEQIKAVDYIETYIQKNYCTTFKNDEICVLSKGINNPIKTWTSEQKAAMWYKLRMHEKELAKRADDTEKERIKKNNELIERVRSIKIQ